MNILLINPPIRVEAEPTHIAIGLGVIANVLANEGYNVKILDLNAERLSNEEVIEKVNLNNKFDIIGIGGLITTYRYLKWLIPEIKKYNPNSIIVIGGGVVTESPTLLLSKTPADIAVICEGEITMKELVATIKKNKSYKDINGIAYKDNGEIKINPPRPLIKDLDELPLPAYELFPINIYLKNVSHGSIIGKKSEMGIITTRGCPFNCHYCYHIFGRGVRTRSIDNVINEIKYLIDKFNVESILILDETFTINKKRVKEFCQKVISEKIKIPWSCYARVNLIDKIMLKMMKAAGCYRVGYGIESGSQKILDNMNKGVTVEQAKKAIKITRKVGLNVGATFMFGYPGETLETIQETIEFCDKLNLSPTFFFTTPYPGTKLYIDMKERILEKFNNEDKFFEVLGDAKEFTINLSDFSNEELFELKKKAENDLKIKTFKKKLQNYNNKLRIYGFFSSIKKINRKILGIFFKRNNTPKSNIKREN
ncbi:MAG: B12-binding domain-containing radical SAM protein [Candidatus Hermodarchaeota archaeon]